MSYNECFIHPLILADIKWVKRGRRWVDIKIDAIKIRGFKDISLA